ncbi:MAG: tetratricopeptide repeat protein, partial [Candidatus Krumholzibacteriia bacterium]
MAERPMASGRQRPLSPDPPSAPRPAPRHEVVTAPGARVAVIGRSQGLALLAGTMAVLVLLHPSSETYRSWLRRDGRQDEAARQLDREIARRGGNVARLSELARLRLALGDEEPARDLLRRWAALDPEAVEPRTTLGELSLRRHGAVASAKIDAAGFRHAAELEGAGGFQAAGRLADAEGLQGARELEGATGLERAWDLEGATWLDDAAYWFGAALALAPHDSAIRERLVETHRWAGRSGLAAAVLVAARPHAGTSHQLTLIRRAADLYLEAGDPARAAEILHQSRSTGDLEFPDLERLVDLEVMSGRPDEALPFARELLARRPRDAAARQQLAQLYMWTGQPGRAWGELAVLMHDRPHDAELRERVLKLGFEAGRLRELRDLLRELALAATEWREASLRLGDVELGLGNLRAAVHAFEAYLRRNPEDSATRARLARIYAESDQFEQAMDHLSYLRANSAGDPGPGLEIAHLLLLQGRYDEAEAWLDRMLVEFPDEVDVARAAAGLAIVRWRVPASIRAHARIARLVPGDLTAWREWSRSMLHAGDDRGASAVIEQGLTHHPESIVLLEDLVTSLERQKRDADLVPWLEKLHERKPSDHGLALRLVRAEIRTGRRGEARRRLRDLADRRLGLASAIEAATLLGELGEHEEAIRRLEQLRDGHPGRFEVHSALLSEARRAGAIDAALEHVQPCLAYARTPAQKVRILGTAAEILMAADRPLDAAAYLEQSARIDPHRSRTWIHLARARNATGNRVAATRAASEAWNVLAADGDLRLFLDSEMDHTSHPAGLEVLQDAATVLELMGRRRQARAVLERTVAAHPEAEWPALELVRLHVEAGQFPQAEALLATLMEREPRPSQALYWTGVIRMRQSRFDEARRIFAALCRSATDSSTPYFGDWAYAAVESGHYAEALNAFDLALRQAGLSASDRTEMERSRAIIAAMHASHARLQGEVEWRDGTRERWFAGSRARIAAALHLAAGAERSRFRRDPDPALGGLDTSRDAGRLDLVWYPKPAHGLRLKIGVASVRDATPAGRERRLDRSWGMATLGARLSMRRALTFEPEIAWNEPLDATTILSAVSGRRRSASLALGWRMSPRAHAR